MYIYIKTKHVALIIFWQIKSASSSFQMPVSVGPYGQTQPSCFDRVKMGFMMGFAVGMAAGAMFGTFSCLRYEDCHILGYL